MYTTIKMYVYYDQGVLIVYTMIRMHELCILRSGYMNYIYYNQCVCSKYTTIRMYGLNYNQDA